MARYMLSVHSVEGDGREPPSAEEMQHNWQQLQLVEAEMKSTGAWIFSGRLHDATRADLLWRLGRQSDADTAYARAAALAPTGAERQFLSRGGRGARS